MAVTVKRAFLKGVISWYISKAQNVRLMSDVLLCLELKRGNRVFVVELLFKKGYESDGLSRPEILKSGSSVLMKKIRSTISLDLVTIGFIPEKGC